MRVASKKGSTNLGMRVELHRVEQVKHWPWLCCVFGGMRRVATRKTRIVGRWSIVWAIVVQVQEPRGEAASSSQNHAARDTAAAEVFKVVTARVLTLHPDEQVKHWPWLCCVFGGMRRVATRKTRIVGRWSIVWAIVVQVQEPRGEAASSSQNHAARDTAAAEVFKVVTARVLTLHPDKQGRLARDARAHLLGVHDANGTPKASKGRAPHRHLWQRRQCWTFRVRGVA